MSITLRLGRESINRFLAVAVTLAFVMIVEICFAKTGVAGPSANGSTPPRIRLAVLGDSDSHSYADEIWFPKDGDLRGGKYREQTLQWTEVLAAFRDAEVDQGKWGTWGTAPRIARIAGLVGIHLRSPRKQDYEYNFATSGAVCSNLIEHVSAQTPQLLHLVSEDESGWQNAIVQIRIGINTLGRRAFLDQVAADGLSEAILEEINACVEAIETSVRMIRQQQPELNIVLVGVLNNSDWPPNFDYWQSSIAQERINSALDLFDSRLQELAKADNRVEFFDDRAWFQSYWGERAADGKPDYRAAELASGIVITNTQGDSWEHFVVEDGHGGTLSNALWVRDFINFVNARWGLSLTPISDQELIDLAESMKSRT